ncbi:hypothetical protein ACWEKM_27325 [Streptomyces sp. NPDC004752]
MTRWGAERGTRVSYATERDTYPQALEDYLRTHLARLERLWHVHGPDGLFPDGLFPGVHHLVHLVELPEAFVLYESIDRTPLALPRLRSDTAGP